MTSNKHLRGLLYATDEALSEERHAPEAEVEGQKLAHSGNTCLSERCRRLSTENGAPLKNNDACSNAALKFREIFTCPTCQQHETKKQEAQLSDCSFYLGTVCATFPSQGVNPKGDYCVSRNGILELANMVGQRTVKNVFSICGGPLYEKQCYTG